MAVETKIGLLVGLAFIVCFGIILSHRGGGDRITAEVARDLLRRHGQPKPTRPAERMRSPSRQHRTGSGSSLTQKRTTNEARRGGVVAPGAARTRVRPRRIVLPKAASRETEEALKSSGAARGGLMFDRLFPEGDRSDEAVPGSVTPGPVNGPRVVPPKRSPSLIPAGRRSVDDGRDDRYVVRSGDTLWGIAARVYGSRSRKLVDALFDANRDLMARPDELRIGMRLRVPSVGLRIKSVPSSVEDSRRVETGTGAPFRSYQVRPGDRYATIAERLLNDKSRWRELYELNKDIFPEADRIRPGVRIRIPATVVAQAGYGSR